MRQISWVSLALIAAPLWAADVYRSVDADGNVAYSDRPGASTERIFLATPGVSSSPRMPQSGAARPAAEPAGEAQSEALVGETRVEPSAAEIAAERARNCESSQEREERYRLSQRLYRNLPNGEREYLSDAELEEARAKAVADVANWCS